MPRASFEAPPSRSAIAAPGPSSAATKGHRVAPHTPPAARLSSHQACFLRTELLEIMCDFLFFFFFFGRRRQDERGCGDGFPSDSVWLRLAVVSVCSPRTHEQREEARGRERGQCWPPRPAARPAPRADRRARAGDGDRKAACPRSRRESRAPPWAPAACPWGTDPHGPLLSTPSSFTCSRLSSGTRKGHWSPSRVIRNQKGKTDSPKAPGGGRADASFRPARTPHPQT